ncbi:amidase [Bryobacterales bacterium F-183]|nr:amidase [Bryobacterales bacterium F-183]
MGFPQILPAVLMVAQMTEGELTIAKVHAQMRAGRLTCTALVQGYLERIRMYDKQGSAINAIVVVNPEVLREAKALDGVPLAQRKPLHCVPLIVKDNIETAGLQTANGSLSLAGYVPEKDAFQVRQLKAAGALVLAKSNMAEWAFSPYETVSSILPGYTRNPYDTARVSAGSSGGTAAAIAANFGLVGLGSDTGNSIRGPSAHQALVGIRSTMGLTSRAGVFPLSDVADIAGPMARTVEDAARIFQFVVGFDAEDGVTAAAKDHPVPDYSQSLKADGLKGARIGILRQAYERDTTDAEVVRVFERAVQDLRRAGAVIVDPAKVEGLDALQRPRGSCMAFHYAINRFLGERAGKVPMKDLDAIVKSGKVHPSVLRQLENAAKGPANGPETEACVADREYRQKVRDAVTATMDRLKLDAFVYPTWSNPPRLIGDLNTPHGDNSQFFSPVTGFPAMTVPMGYTRGGTLPAGMTFFGRAWAEATLIRLGYAYEQATRHRRPPELIAAPAAPRQAIARSEPRPELRQSR